MQRLTDLCDPAEVEASVRAFWIERNLQATPGSVGPASGPGARQFLGSLSAVEPPLDLLSRAVFGDAQARYAVLRGQRSSGVSIVRSGSADPWVHERRALLDQMGCWTSVGPVRTLDEPGGAERLQSIVDQLARTGLVVTRNLPLRYCPRCRSPRSPETIVYQAQRAPAYLVRFPIRDSNPPVSLLVWVDAPWKLLGTSAVLVNPDLRYVRAVYRRRGVEEQIVVTESALDRLKRWLPNCELEVLASQTGRELGGTRYLHPVATEFPAITDLPAPAGTVIPSSDVGDSGTGLVALVPSHGAADAAAAATLHVTGPTVLEADGKLRAEDRHKYTRLPIDAADAFILRDLTEGGLVFAQLTVRRGVPYCSICGRGLLWLPGRAWCLEMTRLPPSIQRQFSQLLPNDPLPTGTEIVPWPFSHFPVSEDRLDPQLLECGSCDRVFPTGAPPACVCGSPLAPVRRSLLAAPLEALLAWSTGQPGESAQLFVSDRRRAPAVLHHLIARESAGARGNEVRLVLLPTMPPADLLPLTAPDASKDALRAALIGLSILERGPSSVLDRCRQEARRLRKFWELSRSLIDGMIREGIPFDDEPMSTRVQGLPEEDRAFLSRFERLRIDVRSLYEAQQLAQAQDRLVRFMEEELRGGYLPMVRFRLEPTASSAARAATYQLLARVLTEWAELSAPIAPFTMEAVTRGFLEDQRSLFERGFTSTNETLLDATREAEYDRWVSFAEALQRARREVGLPVDAILPKVVLLVADDRLGAELSRSSGVLERLGRVGRIDVDSPQHPWAGRRIEARPVSSEIQRAYGAQAPRILRLLEHMPGRKILDGIQAGSLTLALEGQTVSILPSMVELMESLPECVVPIPWQDGEILLVDPTEKTGGQLPSLSLDGFGIVRHIQRRVRRARVSSPPQRVLVAASGILSDEIAHHASAIAKHIGIPRVEIAEDATSFPSLERSFGRTRRGDRWSVWIPGVQVEPARPKQRTSSAARSRVRPLTESADRAEDLLDDQHLAEYSAISELADRVETEFGRRIAGPAKIAVAWEAGYHALDDLAHAAYADLEALPGFGPVLAAEIVTHFGGKVPPQPRLTPRSKPSERVPGSRLPSPGVGPSGPARSGGTEPTMIPGPGPLRSATDFARGEVTAPTPLIGDSGGSGVPGAGPAVAQSPTSSIPGREAPLAAGSRPAPPSPIRAVPPGGRPLPPKLQFLTPTAGPRPGLPAADVPTGGTGPAILGEPPAPPSPGHPWRLADSPPLPPPPTPPPELPTGVALWEGAASDLAWNAFLEITAKGRRGICITREPPGARRAALGRRDVEVVWLSNIPLGPSNPTARPGDLEGLGFGIADSFATRNVEAVFLDGIEYLSSLHAPEKIRAFLAAVDASAREHHAQVLVPLRLGLMGSEHLALLGADFRRATS